jgi:hypothetical protein
MPLTPQQRRALKPTLESTLATPLSDEQFAEIIAHYEADTGPAIERLMRAVAQVLSTQCETQQTWIGDTDNVNRVVRDIKNKLDQKPKP